MSKCLEVTRFVWIYIASICRKRASKEISLSPQRVEKVYFASWDAWQLQLKRSVSANVPLLMFVKMQVNKLLPHFQITSSTWSHKDRMYFGFWQILMEKDIVCQIYIICCGSAFQFFFLFSSSEEGQPLKINECGDDKYNSGRERRRESFKGRLGNNTGTSLSKNLEFLCKSDHRI